MKPGGGAIAVSLLIAYVLEVVALPDWLETARPCWVAMIILYWVMAVPHRVGVISAWFAGLFLDVLQGDVLGQNALSLALVAYVTYLLHLRIRVFPIWQQCISLFVLIGIFQLVALLVQRSVHTTPWTMSYWLAAITSGLFWPFVLWGLRDIRRRYRVG